MLARVRGRKLILRLFVVSFVVIFLLEQRASSSGKVVSDLTPSPELSGEMKDPPASPKRRLLPQWMLSSFKLTADTG